MPPVPEMRTHSEDAPDPSGRLPLAAIRNRHGYHWFVVGTVCVGAFLAALNASIVNIALPTLQRQFDVSLNSVEWVSLVYLLTLAALIVPFGRAADMFGRRWMYTFGFVVFIIGSLLCGLANDYTFLLIARIITAVGAAMLQANSIAIITASAPARDRGKAIGIQGSAQGVGLSLGATVGGALLSFLNWRWIFYINIPVGIVGTIFGILFLPRDVNLAKREKFDFLGACLLAPALVALIYCLNTGLKQGWLTPPIMVSYAVAVFGMALFIWVEKRSAYPMIDLSLFKIPIFAIGNITGVLSFAVMYAISLLGPFYLDSVDKMSPFVAGLYLTVIPIGMTIFTPLAGALADKFGSRLLTVSGMLASVLGCLALALMGTTISPTLLIVGLFLVGTGLGLFTPPNNSSVMGSAPIHRLGVAGGILNMSRTLGMGLGITFGGLSYQIFLSVNGALSERTATLGQMSTSFQEAFVAIGAIALVTLVLSGLRRMNDRATAAK